MMTSDKEAICMVFEIPTASVSQQHVIEIRIKVNKIIFEYRP